MELLSIGAEAISTGAAAMERAAGDVSRATQPRDSGPATVVSLEGAVMDLKESTYQTIAGTRLFRGSDEAFQSLLDLLG